MNNALTIGFTGDVMLGRTLDRIISKKGYDYPWGDVLPLMRSTDINIINLETTLTSSCRKVYKAFNFKAAPDKVKCLINARVSVANLANNHILDYGDEGLEETINTLDAANIAHVGAGKNLAAAIAPVVVDLNNMHVGILAITDNEPGWKAGWQPGTNYANISEEEDYTRLLQAMKNLKNEVDIIIITVHWGPNMRNEPTRDLVQFAHLMSEEGAHIIHGHSAHIIQAVEHYKNSLILYDTGDFIDDYIVDPYQRNDLAAFFVVMVDRCGPLSLKIVPTRIFQYQVTVARNDDRNWILNRINYLSSAFGTQLDEEGSIDLRAALLGPA